MLKSATQSDTLTAILDEVRMLRKELSFLIPTESIGDYAHPKRLKRSLEKAMKEHPPASSSL
ncbi:MAG: hypothetical protein Q7J22_00030 [Candidatus Wolfebacteria bacterium]|nr:hypothetical protein [Candidatus Wolfebacteria bacterium]